MRLIRTRPADPFDACVECFWFSEREAPQCAVEHMLPSGGVSLVFALHEAPLSCLPGSADGGEPTIWSRGVVHGPQGNYFLSGPKPSGAVVGVSFRPGAASAVLGVPVTELTDRHSPSTRCGERAASRCANGLWRPENPDAYCAFWSKT